MTTTNYSPNEFNFLIQEYNLLWSYYHKSIDERISLFNMYLKFIPLSASLFGFTLALPQAISLEISETTIGAILIVISSIGMSIYITYTMQCKNAKILEISLHQIRSHIKQYLPRIDSAIIIDSLRQTMKTASAQGTIKFWRGNIISITNSAIFTAGVFLVTSQSCLPIEFAIFILLLLSHYLIYELYFSTYKRQQDD